MFSSPILDLVILLSFIYFVGSLIISSINEAIAASWSLRPKQLEAALENLLFDNLWPNFLKTKLITSPHIESLMKARGVYPSYIPAQNFVLAIIGIIGDQNYTSENLLKAIKTTAAFPPQFQKILADLAVQAGSSLPDFEKSLAAFYTNAMDRTGGVYKRKIRLILFILGLIVAVGANLDTIQIAQDALNTKAQLSQTIDKIVSQMPAIKSAKGAITVNYSSGAITVSQQDTNKTAVSNSIKQVSQLATYLKENTGIGLGYSNWDAFTNKWEFKKDHYGNFFLALLGILLTTFALQLSSSFWFDLMNKAVNMRGAGQKPDTKNKK